ncbi:MAG: acyltransferase [Deltaproteobacteria bacterium]|nr:acyltransferase [Deltaproteobacteria bacterium]
MKIPDVISKTLVAWLKGKGGLQQDWKDHNRRRIQKLRSRGVSIGRDCLILTENFSTEPYLIEIGDHVGIAGGVQFITHVGEAWVIRDECPNAQILGRIRIGNNCVIGMNAVIMPGTTIGSDCVVGANSVVKGEIPDNSVVAGNPARVIKTTHELKEVLLHHPDRLDTLNLPPDLREKIIKEHFKIA